MNFDTAMLDVLGSRGYVELLSEICFSVIGSLLDEDRKTRFETGEVGDIPDNRVGCGTPSPRRGHDEVFIRHALCALTRLRKTR